MNEDTPKSEVVPIGALVADAANVRIHGERNRQAIRSSVRRFGAARSIVIDGKGIVRAGNGTLEAAAAEGIDRVRIVDAEPGELIAVRRADWSPSEATAYAIADNRSALDAEWDYEGLAATIKALKKEEFDISVLGFPDHELEPLLAADWTPPALDDMPGDDGESGGDAGPNYTVTFSADQWETIEQACDKVREVNQAATLAEAACLALIASDYVLS